MFSVRTRAPTSGSVCHRTPAGHLNHGMLRGRELSGGHGGQAGDEQVDHVMLVLLALVSMRAMAGDDLEVTSHREVERHELGHRMPSRPPESSPAMIGARSRRRRRRQNERWPGSRAASAITPRTIGRTGRFSPRPAPTNAGARLSSCWRGVGGQLVVDTPRHHRDRGMGALGEVAERFPAKIDTYSIRQLPAPFAPASSMWPDTQSRWARLSRVIDGVRGTARWLRHRHPLGPIRRPEAGCQETLPPSRP